MMFLGVVALIGLIAVNGEHPEEGHLHCRTFEEIYGGGESLCNNMWGESFRYVPKDDPEYNVSYTMWFFDDENPNDSVTKSRLAQGLHDANYSNTDVCHLQYFHYDKPQTEGNDFTECHPWYKNACCKEETVESGQKMKESYGAEWHWDRCGPLSQECERFFVQESCFYECDVNAGLFRKYAPHLTHNSGEYNEWEMYRMPIKADYCDAFYRACRDQKFCAHDNGNFFECAKIAPTAAPTTAPVEEVLAPGIIAAIVIVSILLVGILAYTFVLITKERAGTPMFKPIEPSKPNEQEMQEQGSSFRQQVSEI